MTLEDTMNRFRISENIAAVVFLFLSSLASLSYEAGQAKEQIDDNTTNIEFLLAEREEDRTKLILQKSRSIPLERGKDYE